MFACSEYLVVKLFVNYSLTLLSKRLDKIRLLILEEKVSIFLIFRHIQYSELFAHLETSVSKFGCKHCE
jgi:hypothetical protein